MTYTEQFDYSDLTIDNYRKEHLSITEAKTGKGEKQETVWYIRDRDDPKGEQGSQRTVLNKAAVEWEVERAHASALQIRCNQGDLLLAAAQKLTRISLRKP